MNPSLIVLLLLLFTAAVANAYMVTRGEQSPALDDAAETRERKRRAKQLNERLKLLATLANNLAIATFVAMVLTPISRGEALSVDVSLLAAGTASILHLIGQAVLHLWKSED